MATRVSGYPRRPRDAYDTPEWVLDVLLEHWHPGEGAIWEPAAGAGNLLRPLRRHWPDVIATDAEPRHPDIAREDFHLAVRSVDVRTIITNPPYGRELEPFARRACDLMRMVGGKVALLTPVGFPTTAGRADLCSTEAGLSHIIHITPRIRWIKDSTGAPSADHHWLCWDFRPGRALETRVVIGAGQEAA